MKISILGAGYVGLPLAIEFSKIFNVVCYDIDKNRIKNLMKGIDLNNQHNKNQIINKNLLLTNKLNNLKKSDYYIITVPTPIDDLFQPDLTYLKSATKNVAKLLKKKSIIIYESTTYPGCTEEICIPILKKYSKLKYNKDFFVAYSPERVNPGDKVNTLKSITKIVGSDNRSISNKVKKLYKKICKNVYLVNSLKIAESAKVIENIQRDVNIALINELSILFQKLKIPSNDVFKAAATKWNFHYYKPGLVGGHCISVDPYYLAYKAIKNDYIPELILSGRRYNENMGKYIASETVKILIKNNVNLLNSKIAILGFSFKENISDFRNTKVIQIIDEFKNLGLSFQVFDDHVQKQDVKKIYDLEISSFKNIIQKQYDCIIFAVSHNEFKKPIVEYNNYFKNKKKIIIDIKNMFSSEELKKEKFKFFQL